MSDHRMRTEDHFWQVVYRDGFEVEHFDSKEEAVAFAMHVDADVVYPPLPASMFVESDDVQF